MTFDPTIVETVTVDSYGTLVDPSTVERALEASVDAEHVQSISNQWRSRSLLYTMVSNATDSYQPFYAMNRDALCVALAAHDVELSSEAIEAILATYHDLDPFEDVTRGLEAITDAGYDVFVVSNGNPEMLESMVETAGLESVLAGTISADEIRTFKPDSEMYRHAAARTGTPIESIAHVAGPTFDVQGAMHAGMQGVWIDRTNSMWDPFADEPDLTVETFDEVAAELST
ncbi:haloacid dehalogenase type II [Natronorubrum sulfidifaciens]|uniref:Haloacid dehalogenase n=1 Tax=Natronorubrum sulfidifaciens JCM 14089 TaxID=1230460 RepID=L9WJQ7_9EURY|nr:haloacid dehalogenase type II [Natronorubrum sulfidifaciens]ELY49446.1 haloacid dehalogenase [Natronorubrum sulfidifaciens JCM 14089]